MKLKRIVPILVIVVLFHLVLWFMLSPSKENKTDDENKDQPPTEEVQPGAENKDTLPPADGGKGAEGTSLAGAEVVPKPAEAARPVAKNYSEFVNDPADMPAQLEKKMSGCRSGILVDLESRRILWQMNAEHVYAIASMSKIMTAYEIMRELKTPGCPHTLETRVQVTKHMFKKFKDCHIYMDPRESFTLDELLKCMMIHSANDCAYLAGEFLAGTEEAFVERMNATAASLGFKSFSFCNTNGLPDRQNKRANRGNALEMAYLAERVMDIPEIMKWAGTKNSSIREDKRKFDLNNKNHLLNDPKCPGINGLKTGYIDDARYCITTTCERDGRRMICVVMGADTAKVRDQIVRELLNWGYAQFKK